MERRGWTNLGGAASFHERALLMRLAPRRAIAIKQGLVAGTASSSLVEEFEAFGREFDMADLASL